MCDLFLGCEEALKETGNSVKNWPLKLSWILNETIMEVGNIIRKLLLLKVFLLSYKNTQLLFCDSAFWYFHETNINQRFLGVTQKYELCAFPFPFPYLLNSKIFIRLSTLFLWIMLLRIFYLFIWQSCIFENIGQSKLLLKRNCNAFRWECKFSFTT